MSMILIQVWRLAATHDICQCELGHAPSCQRVWGFHGALCTARTAEEISHAASLLMEMSPAASRSALASLKILSVMAWDARSLSRLMWCSDDVEECCMLAVLQMGIRSPL